MIRRSAPGIALSCSVTSTSLAYPKGAYECLGQASVNAKVNWGVRLSFGAVGSLPRPSGPRYNSPRKTMKFTPDFDMTVRGIRPELRFGLLIADYVLLFAAVLLATAV